MKINFVKTISYLLIMFFFTGCINNTLSLEHNEERKETLISLSDKVYNLKDSILTQTYVKGNTPFSNLIGSRTKSYTSNDICKHITFKEFPPLGSGRFYLTSARSDVEKFSPVKCDVKLINGLHFHDCQTQFVITLDNNGDSGVAQKKYLFVSNRECFNNLKSLMESDIHRKSKEY